MWIDGEPTLISELLSNLLDNALAHTAAGGNVVLRVLDGGVLEVEDDGPGVPADERELVFSRFYRLSHNTRGSGLGLAIVDAIAKSHGGHCAVADTPGGGATFTIEIPIGTRASLPTPVRAGDVVLQREASG